MSGKIVAGVIQHPDSSDPNLVLNDDGTVDLFGGDGLGDVVGPVSSTDNALVRFDGTGGKTVQSSGITVDDSGNVSSNLTVSKASAILNVSATSGYPELKLTRNAGNYGLIGFYTGSSPRFQMGVTEIAESGSSAGSNFAIYRQNDAGTTASTPFEITRSSGKVTLGNVGATAGLELGTSGPRVMSGTGSPEGVVTAPVGSQWIDTAATTGAVKWIKATGTGNTGWVVEYGDTGLRNVSALIPAAHLALNPNVKASIRRVGSLVTFFYSTGSSPTATGLQTLTDGTTVPSGFRFDKTDSGRTPTGIMLLGSSGAGSSISLYMSTTSAINSATHVSGTAVQGSISWTTGDAWPASLPGSAA